MSDDHKDTIQAFMPPFGNLLGIQVTKATKDHITAEFTVREDMCTIGEIMHGGAIMAIADNQGAVGAALNMKPGTLTSTIESKTNFISAIPLGDVAVADTTPVHIGGTVQVWQTKISRQDGRLAAIVTQSQIVKKAKL